MPEKKTISVREVVADIRVGLTDDQLMAKHQLSIRGLRSLKNKLLAAGVLTQPEIDGKAIPARVAASLADKKALARNIAEAVRAGLSDDEIIKKFGIPAVKLPGVLASLIKAGYLIQDHLDYRPGGFKQTMELGTEVPIPKQADPLTDQKTTRDVLRDLARRFNIPSADLERLKTASIKDIKALFEKHNVPLSQGKEVIKVLGFQVGDFLLGRIDKLKEIAQGNFDGKKMTASPTPAESVANQPRDDSENEKVSWSHDDKAIASIIFAGLMTGWALAQHNTISWLWFVVWLLILSFAAMLGYYLFLDRYKTKVKYVVIVGVVFLLAGIGNIGGSKPTLTTFDEALATYDPVDGSPYLANPASRPGGTTLLLFTGDAVALIKDDILLVNDTSEREGQSRHWALKTNGAASYKPKEGEPIGVIGRIVDVLKAESEDGTPVGVLLVDPVVMANAPDSLIPLSR